MRHYCNGTNKPDRKPSLITHLVLAIALSAAAVLTFCAPMPAHAADQQKENICSFLANVAGKSVVLKAAGVPIEEVIESVKGMPKETWEELKPAIIKAVRFGYAAKAADPYKVAEFMYVQCMQPRV